MTIRVMWIGVLMAAVLLGFIFGWFPRDRSWQAGTGWDRIPEKNLPPGGISDQLFADRAGGPTVRWLGHAGFIIEWAGQRFLLDPNLQKRVTLSRRFIHPSAAVLTNRIDFVLISHAHYDHLSPATLRSFAGIGRIVVPAGSEVYLPDTLPGQPEVTGLLTGEEVRIGPLTVTAVPARHNGSRRHPWKSRYKAAGYVVSDGTDTLYFAGDTGYQPEANRVIRDRFHPDTAILPIGAYAPRIPFKIHHIDPREAVATGGELGVRKIVPCHFGTYRLTLDEPSRALRVFARIAREASMNWSMPVYHE